MSSEVDGDHVQAILRKSSAIPETKERSAIGHYVYLYEENNNSVFKQEAVRSFTILDEEKYAFIMALKTLSENLDTNRSKQDPHRDEHKCTESNSSRERTKKSKFAMKKSLKIPDLRLRRRLVFPEPNKQEYKANIINPIYALSVPIWVTSPPIIPASTCYGNAETPVVLPVVSKLKREASEESSLKEFVSPVEYSDYNTKNVYDEISEEENENEFNKEIERKIKVLKPIEAYLNLPKELFPSARTLTVDPNPLIDEFCKFCDIHNHAPWILDLEFGIPNCLITRPIPMYNVKYNCVNCKNAPDAIHPGFESCSRDFKRAFLFYYDGIISNWYRGFTVMNNDKSVENFQAWILLPMQALGMCWP
ncbi:hypothetical protein K1T71_001107 [Dendrolimus kikuchii]|uniref:Uncharacterized protein n=1 Tax=Dendrolimus kikuchii TaxID=765133 RepID=A0ACC1DGW0_9NEOP|nr:hypothetical protein K1T71_001107 [Dendrolimus kikuchii]